MSPKRQPVGEGNINNLKPPSRNPIRTQAPEDEKKGTGVEEPHNSSENENISKSEQVRILPQSRKNEADTKYVQANFRFTQKQKTAIGIAAAQQNVDKSTIVREAIDAYLKLK